MDAHFLFDGTDGDAVALPQRPIFGDHELGHDEERHALDALRPAFDFGQHEVDDVVGHVMLTGGDEDLLARDLVAAIVLRGRLGAHQAQIGAAMRLGQVHGAGPVSYTHLTLPTKA